MALADEDRRKFPRFDFSRRMKFRRSDGADWKNLSRIMNVSEGGLQFTCRDHIPINTILHFEIDGSHDERPVALRGRVIWINEAPGSQDLFYSGVSFLDIQDDARSVILSHSS